MSSNVPLNSLEIAEKIKRNRSSVIRALNELVNLDAIVEVAKVDRWRMYRLSEKGRSTFSLLLKVADK